MMEERLAPFISIVIPCRNESRHISDCLDSILANDYPQSRYEVLIADGLSTDDTREIILGYSKKNNNIRLLDNPGKTTPRAFNIGIKNAIGEYILILSAHSTYPKSYISDTLRLFVSNKVGNAGGRFENVPNGNGLWAMPIAYVTGHRFGVGNGAFRTVTGGACFADTVAFGFYKKSIFNEIGFFDERLTRNQDNELNDRLRRAGYKIILDPAIKIFYKNQAELRGLVRQGYNTGMWNFYTLALFPYSFKWRRFVPALFVMYVLLIPLIWLWSRNLLLTFAPLTIYLALNVIFSLSANCGPLQKICVGFTFLSYHLSYGLGTLIGVLRVLTGWWRNELGKPLVK